MILSEVTDKFNFYLIRIFGLRFGAGLLNIISTIAIIYFGDDFFASQFFYLLATSFIISVISRGGLDISVVKNFSSDPDFFKSGNKTLLKFFVFFAGLFLTYAYLNFLNLFFFSEYDVNDVILICFSVGFLSVIITNGFFEIGNFKPQLGLIHQNVILPFSIILLIFLFPKDFKPHEFFFLVTSLALLISFCLSHMTNKSYSFSVEKKRCWLFYKKSISNLPLLSTNVLITWLPIYFSGALLSPSKGSEFSAVARILSSITMIRSVISTYFSPKWAKLLKNNNLRHCKKEWHITIKYLSFFSVILVITSPLIYLLLDWFLKLEISDSVLLIFLITMAHAYSLAMAPCGAILSMSGNANRMFLNNAVSLLIGFFVLLSANVSQASEFALYSILIVSLFSGSLNFFSAKKVLT
jgi:O-antigen/teichoic acid export membrane protein